jgi:cyanophycinase
VQTNDQIDALNVTGARLTYLDRGDSYNVGSRRITPSDWKQRGTLLDPHAKGYKPEYATPLYYTDMLGDTALVNAMGYLIDSSLQEVRGLTFDPLAPASDKRADLAFQFRLYKGPDTVGWYSDELGGDDYSVSNLYLDIIPVRMARPFTTPWAPH